eukprot:6057498-Prorocentrum_lima.AAC.1
MRDNVPRKNARALLRPARLWDDDGLHLAQRTLKTSGNGNCAHALPPVSYTHLRAHETRRHL